MTFRRNYFLVCSLFARAGMILPVRAANDIAASNIAGVVAAQAGAKLDAADSAGAGLRALAARHSPARTGGTPARAAAARPCIWPT